MAISTSGFDDVENIYEYHKLSIYCSLVNGLGLFPVPMLVGEKSASKQWAYTYLCTHTPKLLCIIVLQKTIFLMCNCSPMPITGLHLF